MNSFFVFLFQKKHISLETRLAPPQALRQGAGRGPAGGAALDPGIHIIIIITIIIMLSIIVLLMITIIMLIIIIIYLYYCYYYCYYCCYYYYYYYYYYVQDVGGGDGHMAEWCSGVNSNNDWA